MAATRVALALLLAAAWQAAEAANYTVGDDKGWNPDVDYTAWVKKHKPFYQGDWLIFQYQTGRADVVQVGEVGYDKCDKESALSSYSKGTSYAFQLKDAKDYYFICSYGYCYSGMKLHLTAKSKSGSGSAGSGSGSSSSSSSDSSSDDDSSPSPPAKKTKAKSTSAASPSLLAAATPRAAAAALTAAVALLLNRML